LPCRFTETGFDAGIAAGGLGTGALLVQKRAEFDHCQDLLRLSQGILDVKLPAIEEAYRDLVLKVRDLGIALSDRRAVKVQKLIAASAVLCGRSEAQLSDLWVLRYVWDREEQIEPLASLVNRCLEESRGEPKRHALAQVGKVVDAELLAQQIEAAANEMAGSLSLASVARLRERLADLADQATWVGDPAKRNFLLERARKCLEKLKS
jgi:MoxR-like ATPase